MVDGWYELCLGFSMVYFPTFPPKTNEKSMVICIVSFIFIEMLGEKGVDIHPTSQKTSRVWHHLWMCWNILAMHPCYGFLPPGDSPLALRLRASEYGSMEGGGPY